MAATLALGLWLSCTAAVPRGADGGTALLVVECSEYREGWTAARMKKVYRVAVPLENGKANVQVQADDELFRIAAKESGREGRIVIEVMVEVKLLNDANKSEFSFNRSEKSSALEKQGLRFGGGGKGRQWRFSVTKSVE